MVVSDEAVYDLAIAKAALIVISSVAVLVSMAWIAAKRILTK
jgi:hypothetical protein